MGLSPEPALFQIELIPNSYENTKTPVDSLMLELWPPPIGELFKER